MDGYNDLGEREEGTRAGLDSLDAELKREPREPDGSWPGMSISGGPFDHPGGKPLHGSRGVHPENLFTLGKE